MIRIKNVEIKWEYDNNPDLSWLDRTAKDHYGKDGCNWNHVSKEVKARVAEEYGSLWAACEAYAAEDQQRLKDFYAGKWCMLGCIAEATVSYPLEKAAARLECFTSSGLWGIESDSDQDYRAEVEMEQLEDLEKHLELFGVDTTNFWEKYEDGKNG